MTVIQFSHANGFPAKSYSYLFQHLPNYKISFVNQFGHDPNYLITQNWDHLTQQLIHDIEKKAISPVIGVGHSLGGVLTLFAAAQRPDLFKKIILLDAPLLSSQKRLTVWIAKSVGYFKRSGLVKKARTRRTGFDSYDDAKDYFSHKALFKSFHHQIFSDYVQHGLKPCEGGYELAYSSQVESDIFNTMPIAIPRSAFQVQGNLIYSKRPDVLAPSDLKWWKRRFKQFQFLPFEGGHLFPMENPQKLAQLLDQLIQAD
jgi:pimeloyl-ACP methyl ester carboxylesterase